MRGNVVTNIIDGGLGNTAAGADGVMLVVGTADSGTPDTAFRLNSLAEARFILKGGELLEFIEHYYAEFDRDKGQKPPALYCIRPTTDIPGAVGAAALSGSGKATAVAAGSPTASRRFLLQIIAGGTPGIATYRKSADGGKTWSDEFVTPADATPINLGFGVTISFTAAATPAESFAIGDEWSVVSTAPGSSAARILSAIETQNQNFEIKMIAICGETDKAFWASCQQIRDDWETLYDHYVQFLLAATSRTTDEVEAWAISRMNEARPFYGRGVCVCAIEGKSDLYGDYRSMLPALAAKASAARVHESVGFVEKFRVLSFSEIRDYEILSAKDSISGSLLDSLDTERLTIATLYNDYPGIFFAHASLMSESTSDYKRLQDLRTIDKARRIVRQSMMRFLESPDHEEAGIGGLKALKADADGALSTAMEVKGDREISGHELIIDPAQDVSTGVKAKLKIYKIGTMESIEVDVSYAK